MQYGARRSKCKEEVCTGKQHMQWHAPQRLGQEAPDGSVWGPVNDQDVASAVCALGWLSRLLRERKRERARER